MDFGTIMGNLGEAAGRVQIATTTQDMRQAQAEDMRAQAQMRQMSALAMQQDVADRKAISDETRAATETFQKSQKTAADVQKLATVREGAAISHNQFDMAKGYGEMAKMAEAEQKTALENKAKERHDQNESIAQAAQAYEAAPTVENARLLANRATQAGQQNIPPVGTPAFASWAVGQKTAAMDSGKLLEWQQKEKDIKAARELKEQKQKEDHEDRLQKQRDIVEERAARHEDKRLQLRVLQEGIQARREAAAERAAEHKAKAGDHGRVGAIEQKVSDTIIRNSAQGVRVIDNMLSAPGSAANSLFNNLKDTSITDALTRAGGNVLTDAADQAVTAIGAEMGVIVGQVVTAGSGRGASLPLIQSFQKMTTPQIGDTPQMKLLRLANAGEILNLELTNITPGATKELEDSRIGQLKFLNKLPTVKDILRSLPAKERDRTMQDYADLQKQTSALQSKASALPADSAGGSGGASALPSGFKEDK